MLALLYGQGLERDITIFQMESKSVGKAGAVDDDLGHTHADNFKNVWGEMVPISFVDQTKLSPLEALLGDNEDKSAETMEKRVVEKIPEVTKGPTRSTKRSPRESNVVENNNNMFRLQGTK